MSERPEFNLLDEPWIPVASLDGTWREVGLREALLEAHQFREVGDPSPLVTVALYRLLIALLHSALDGPRSTAAWGVLWRQGRFAPEQIDPYLDRWRNRFDLFDPVHPFYQRADLEEEYAKPISQIVHSMPTGDGPTLFSHVAEAQIEPFTAAEAARALIGFQAFATGGLITLRKGEDPKLFKSADASPLFKSVVVLATGDTLFELLLLNLHRYAPEDEEPFLVTGADEPAWERDRPTEATDRAPAGYRDLLTWQSRRMRLLLQPSSGSEIRIDRVVALKGNQFPDGWDPRGKETMVSYVTRKGAKVSEIAWFPLGVREERALWRDAVALFQSLESERARPRMFDWIAALSAAGELPRRQFLHEIDAFGIGSDQAKLLFWRRGRMPLPVSMLADAGQVEIVRLALRFAEDTAGAIRWASERFAELALAPASDQPEGRKPDREKAVKPLAQSLALEPVFWSALEPSFIALLRAVPTDLTIDADGNERYGQIALADWRDAVREAALRAVARLNGVAEGSPRALKAAAIAEHDFRSRLAGLTRELNQNAELGANDTEGAVA